MMSSTEQRLFRLEYLVETLAEDVRRLVDMASIRARSVSDLQNRSIALEWLAALAISSSNPAYEWLQASVAARALDNSPVDDGAIAHVERVAEALRSWVDMAQQRHEAETEKAMGDGCGPGKHGTNSAACGAAVEAVPQTRMEQPNRQADNGGSI